MGRLFWKFFFAFLGALLTAGIGVGFAVSLFHEQPEAFVGRFEPSLPPPPPTAGSLPGFAGPPGHELPPGPPPGDQHRPPPPLLPIIAALLASLAASALLAWYFAKPIRHLRWAFGAVADGKLDTRVQPLMEGRRDEIADLGRDFDRMTQKLCQLIESQRRLLHDVSHELRSPLARLQAVVGLARQDPAKVASTLDRIERETARLDTLVGELLTFTRLDAGTGVESRAPLDIIDLIVDIADDARFEAQANGRNLTLSAEGTCMFAGNAESLHRAFENVLRNAIKFTPPGTAVEVTVDRPQAGQLRLSICDHGPGVLPSELETIFEPFHRGAGAASDGFGLGLAIARRAIEAHGGGIRASNRPSGGLCIEIALPVV
jgi:two-component system, OmpR family, sensor kinase